MTDESFKLNRRMEYKNCVIMEGGMVISMGNAGGCVCETLLINNSLLGSPPPVCCQAH